MECGVCWESWDLMWSAELHSKRMKDSLSQREQSACPSLPTSNYRITHKSSLKTSRTSSLLSGNISSTHISPILFPINDSLYSNPPILSSVCSAHINTLAHVCNTYISMSTVHILACLQCACKHMSIVHILACLEHMWACLCCTCEHCLQYTCQHRSVVHILAHLQYTYMSIVPILAYVCCIHVSMSVVHILACLQYKYQHISVVHILACLQYTYQHMSTSPILVYVYSTHTCLQYTYQHVYSVHISICLQYIYMSTVHILACL